MKALQEHALVQRLGPDVQDADIQRTDRAAISV